MKKMILIGGIWTSDEESLIISNSKGSIQSAANNFQLSIIDGFDRCLLEPITILNSPFIGSFPKRFKKACIKSKVFNHSTDKKHRDYKIGFLNLPVIKNLSRLRNIKKALKRIINKSDEYYVIGYSMTYSIVKSLLYAKRLSEKVFTCLFVPDLPEYMSLNDSHSIFDNLKSSIRKTLYNDVKGIDSFVVLTKPIYDHLNVSKPYIVIEGLTKGEERNMNVSETNSKNFTVFYSGSLNIQYGIMELVDAMSFIPANNVFLKICGGGKGAEYIKEKAKQDQRIKYLGLLSEVECKQEQSKSSLLINPRKSDEEYCKYSFPSKIIEYMTSGVPVLMAKLPGIPDEYFKYSFIIDDESPEGIAKAIMRILSLPLIERRSMGESARNFVLREKSCFVQTKKVFDFLEKSSKQND